MSSAGLIQCKSEPDCSAEARAKAETSLGRTGRLPIVEQDGDDASGPGDAADVTIGLVESAGLCRRGLAERLGEQRRQKEPIVQRSGTHIGSLGEPHFTARGRQAVRDALI